MPVRTTVIALACAVGLLVSACSTGIPGVPMMADGALPATGSAQPTGGPGSSQGTPGGDGSSSAGDAGSSSAGDAGSSSAGGDGGDTGLPPASPTLPSLPTGGISGLPTDLGTIPGLDSSCLTVASLLLSVSVLFLGPATGQPITQDQVDSAFAQANDLPAEVAGPVKVLHEAALAAVGKSGAAATEIVTSSAVEQAMDALSKYTDTTCGGR